MTKILETIARPGGNLLPLTCLRIEDPASLEPLFKSAGYRVLTVDLAGVVGEAASFLKIVACFDFGAFYLSFHNRVNMMAFWDLWGDEIRKHPDTAIVLLNADYLMENCINLVIGLISTFQGSQRRLAEEGIKARIGFVAVGSGPNFQDTWLPDNPPPVKKEPVKMRTKAEVRARQNRDRNEQGRPLLPELEEDPEELARVMKNRADWEREHNVKST